VLASAEAAFVAEIDGRIVGEANVSGGGWIDLGVEPSLRRRGIGTALLRAAEEASTAKPTLLMALQSDPPGAGILHHSSSSRDRDVAPAQRRPFVNGELRMGTAPLDLAGLLALADQPDAP